MKSPDTPIHKALEHDLAALRLTRIAEIYSEVLKTAIRKGSSMLEVLATLVAEEACALRERALLRRIRKAKLPKRKTLEEFDFSFPNRIPKQAILRLFDCDFVERHECGVFIGPRGTGKTHLLVALGYRACELGVTVRYTRVVDMLNDLVTAQMNGTLSKAIREYVRPSLLLADEVGYIPIDKRGADLMFQVVAARYEAGSIVLTTNRPFKDWGSSSTRTPPSPPP